MRAPKIMLTAAAIAQTTPNTWDRLNITQRGANSPRKPFSIERLFKAAKCQTPIAIMTVRSPVMHVNPHAPRPFSAVTG